MFEFCVKVLAFTPIRACVSCFIVEVLSLLSHPALYFPPVTTSMCFTCVSLPAPPSCVQSSPPLLMYLRPCAPCPSSGRWSRVAFVPVAFDCSLVFLVLPCVVGFLVSGLSIMFRISDYCLCLCWIQQVHVVFLIIKHNQTKKSQ